SCGPQRMSALPRAETAAPRVCELRLLSRPPGARGRGRVGDSRPPRPRYRVRRHDRTPTPPTTPRRYGVGYSMIACIFPGQGCQTTGMGRSLAEAYPICRQTFDEADDALGERLSRIIFEGPDDQLTLTENAQPSILAVSVAAYRLLESRGLRPQFVAGHSLGEYSAHVAAGTFAFADALRIVRHRGRYMQEAVPVGAGAMAAILGLDADQVERACAEAAQGDVVSAANLNGPGQVVIGGAREAVKRAGERAKALGARRVIPLNVSAPFHTALMKPAEARLTPELLALTVG